jgi:hypothetical protein
MDDRTHPTSDKRERQEPTMTEQWHLTPQPEMTETELQQWCIEKGIETYGTGDHLEVLKAANAYLKWLKA